MSAVLLRPAQASVVAWRSILSVYRLPYILFIGIIGERVVPFFWKLVVRGASTRRRAARKELAVLRTLLKSKIHRATVTDASLHYEGSVTIDPLLMAAADIVEFEQVHVYDVTNGSRLTTYAIPGRAGSGDVCINGAAAHLVRPSDLVIIASYATYSEQEAPRQRPKLVYVDEHNQIRAAPVLVGSP
jgi:aspartate 1-decarboxylase